MRLICGPAGFDVADAPEGALRVTLFGQPGSPGRSSAGEAAARMFRRQNLQPSQRGWDFLAIALSVVAADFNVVRDRSPDGWTREIELDIAVSDPDFWRTQAPELQRALAFLTSDVWTLRFAASGFAPASLPKPFRPANDSVMLLSGGLDSLIGAIDLKAVGWNPLAVSQTVRGDGAKQRTFASLLGLRHVQVNPNVQIPEATEDSQRARSMAFIGFAVATATSLAMLQGGGTVPLFVCENGFIALNAPLTGIRLGSLSTRTAHPEYLGRLQSVLDAAGLGVKLTNPYVGLTKGEMMVQCRDQARLALLAAGSTSCGRFQRFGYRHCGRCVPCQVRRAAFIRWGHQDDTIYIYDNLAKDDADHAMFDDVRAVAMALGLAKASGVDAWIGHALSSPFLDREATRGMLERGLSEFRALHAAYGVK